MGLTTMGCSPILTVHSQPIGAIIELENGERLVTPTECSSSVWPKKRAMAQVSATGYRNLEARVPYRSGEEWMLVLVPEHGPVGTWTEEDLP